MLSAAISLGGVAPLTSMTNTQSPDDDSLVCGHSCDPRGLPKYRPPDGFCQGTILATHRNCCAAGAAPVYPALSLTVPANGAPQHITPRQQPAIALSVPQPPPPVTSWIAVRRIVHNYLYSVLNSLPPVDTSSSSLPTFLLIPAPAAYTNDSRLSIN